MSFTIQKINTIEELKNCEKYKIESNNWSYQYAPNAYFSIAYLEKTGFVVKLICEESNPVNIYTNTNDPVYKDSCMEAFINFFPNEEDTGYLNFEMNSNGAMLSQYGKDRYDRRFLTDLKVPLATCLVNMNKNEWDLELIIPNILIEDIYKRSIESISVISCNFFKVGENDIAEHYLSYAPIKSEHPDFHLSEFFVRAQVN